MPIFHLGPDYNEDNLIFLREDYVPATTNSRWKLSRNVSLPVKLIPNARRESFCLLSLLLLPPRLQIHHPDLIVLQEGLADVPHGDCVPVGQAEGVVRDGGAVGDGGGGRERKRRRSRIGPVSDGDPTAVAGVESALTHVARGVAKAARTKRTKQL